MLDASPTKAPSTIFNRRGSVITPKEKQAPMSTTFKETKLLETTKSNPLLASSEHRQPPNNNMAAQSILKKTNLKPALAPVVKEKPLSK